MSPILIVTRPIATAQRFVAKVTDAAGFEPNVLLSPALSIVPLEVDLPKGAIDHLILTSANGALQAKRNGVPGDTTAWCVGQSTTEVANELGFAASFAGETADDLVATLLNAAPKGRMLHVSGVHTRGNVVQRLTQAGLTARRIAAYDQIEIEPTKDTLDAFAGRHPVVLPLFSPRSAGLLAGRSVAAPVHLVVMSAAVKAALSGEFGVNCHIVEHPTEEEMVKMTAKVLKQLS